MVHLPPHVIPHFAKAVRGQIDWLERVVAESGEQLPEDFEPNDIAMYRSVLKGLLASVETGLDISDVLSKSVRFMMGLLPFYVRQNRQLISSDHYNALFRAYCDFKLEECRTLVIKPRDLRDQSGLGANFRRWARKALTDIERFPE